MNQAVASITTPTISVIPSVAAEQTPDGLLLRETKSPACMSLFLIGFAVLWNLISWPIALVALFGGRSSLGIFALMPLIFVAVGIFLIVLASRQLIIATAFGNAELLIDHLPLRLGGRASLRFRRRVRGSMQVTGLQARLVCREWVRYRAGTDTRTMTHELWSQDLPTAPVLSTLTGEVDVAWLIDIPADQPPSFSVSNNALEWQVEVTMQIARFPDPTATFLLPVLPEVLR